MTRWAGERRILSTSWRSRAGLHFLLHIRVKCTARCTESMGVTRTSPADSLGAYLSGWLASLTVVGGVASGTELCIDQARTRIGRGPRVDFAFDDPAMCAEHALIEFRADGFHLTRTNGGSVVLNGGVVEAGRLKDGDWFGLGSIRFEFHETPRDPRP